MEQRIRLDVSKALEIVESEVEANPSCACEIVKTSINAAPESMRIISRCAIATAPDSIAQVQALLAAIVAPPIENPLDRPYFPTFAPPLMITPSLVTDVNPGVK